MGQNASPLLGTLETALFMPGCTNRFSGKTQAVKNSFLIPFAIFPFSALIFISAHPSESMDATSTWVLASMYGLRIVIYMALFLGVMFVMANKLHKGRDFLKFVQAHNWLDLPAFLVTVPHCLAYASGAYQWEEIYPMLVIASLYGYACLAYAASRIFGLPAELGVSIAAFALVLNQAALGAVKFGMTQAMLYFA